MVICILLLILSGISSFPGARCVLVTHAAENSATPLNPSVSEVISSVRSYMLSVDQKPDYNSTWNVLGMTRSSQGAPSDYQKKYYDNTVNDLIKANWNLNTPRSSDYAKLILGMTVIGKDAQNICGHNLLSFLSDFSYVKKQGFNGPIWALIALNSSPTYHIPEDKDATIQTTEEALIEYILERELPSGGWTLSGNNPDTDITAMTLQALAPYYEIRLDVAMAVERALDWLSSVQMKSGGYGTLSNKGTVETSESASQVIVALSALGIDPAKDSRFIKNGKWPMSRLFEYYLPVGGFMHVEKGGSNNGGGAAGTLDGLATEQGMYACVAYQRMLAGKKALYDMSDVSLSPGQKPATSTSSTTSKESGTGNTSTTSSAKAKVKVTKITLNKQKLFLQKGKTATIKATVTPSTAANKKLKWTSANSKIATVTQKGKVKGIKAGTTVITAKDRDGSGVKASCKVIVSTPASSTSSSNKKSSGSGSGTSSTSSTSGTSSTESYNTTTWSSTTAAGEETTEEEEESTQAGAWSFGGADYKPEGDNEIPQAEGNLWDSEDFEDYEESTELEDPYALSNGEKEIRTNGASNLPIWLSVLLGLAVPAALAGLVAAPWDKIRGKRKK